MSRSLEDVCPLMQEEPSAVKSSCKVLLLLNWYSWHVLQGIGVFLRGAVVAK